MFLGHTAETVSFITCMTVGCLVFAGSAPDGTTATNLFAGTSGSGVFLSTNDGASWTAVNSSLTNTAVLALATSGTNLFAGTQGGGVWRRPLSEMVASAVEMVDKLPMHFSLDQNYPNPFNPSTEIQFSLPRKCHVTLIIFDLLGRQVTTLVSEELSAGSYSTRWDAAGMSTGVYLYRLRAGDPSLSSGRGFEATKKLLLLR